MEHRMVEISKSGSGEGLGWATGPGCSTVFACAWVIKIGSSQYLIENLRTTRLRKIERLHLT